MIIKADVNYLKKVPNIMKFLEEYYGYNETFMMYMVSFGESLGFVTRKGKDYLYIKNNDTLEMIAFTLNENFDLLCLKKDGYIIDFNSDGTDENGIQSYLFFEANGYEDIQGYDGIAVYSQYDPSKDIKCELQYPHMVRDPINNVFPIYEMHTKKFRSVYIDADYEKKGEVDVGFIRKKCAYYNRYIIQSGTPAYRFISLRENWLTKKSYDYPDTIERFCKTKFIFPSGDVITSYPLGELFDESEIISEIEEKGFKSEIPSLVMKGYNKGDSDINEILELSKQIKEIEKMNDEEMKLILRLYEN